MLERKNKVGWDLVVKADETLFGMEEQDEMNDLEKRVDENWDEISSSLQEIRGSIFSREGCLVNLTADEANLDRRQSLWLIFLICSQLLLPLNRFLEEQLPQVNEAIVIPTQVNYVGKAGNVYEAGYELHGSAYVISKHIGNTWLWDRVRVSGGAYGGFCDFDTHSGVFSYLSYRDPNLLKTLEVYDGTTNFLRELELDNDALTKAIIGTIGDVDAYQLPDAKGYSSLLRHLLGITDEERERRREEILSTSLKDFKDFADFLEAVKKKGVVVAVASAEDVAVANEEKSGFFDVKNVL
ncbi:hypothetical protein HPP92_005654 [Vanilla planifolia]|uniref:Presequence protease mitochondrial-type C-terminal domain-containing protein n=1 Tax=Vanilla planifolia TaxID=51239 RepID=A0A835RLU1_VANPL|nr:hypothetical protein HPP92_005654 [Vanilla planifolia]